MCFLSLVENEDESVLTRVCIGTDLNMSVCTQDKQRMTDKLEDTSLRLKDEMDLYRKMMDKLKQNRHEYQKEKDAMQEVI